MVAVSALVLGSIAQAADKQVGTWKLNLDKSKYSPGPPPKEMTVTVKSQPNGIKVTAHGANAEGQPIHYEFSAKYDGKDYPMTGNAEADTISIKKIDSYTNEASTKKGGTPLLTIRIVVSKTERRARAPRRVRTPAPGCKQHSRVRQAMNLQLHRGALPRGLHINPAKT
jgi:hypothetical protein